MNRFSLLAVLFLAAAVSAADKNEQSGRFFLYKVKLTTPKQVEELLRPNSIFGDHPPIFIQDIQVGDYNLVLIEQSKVPVFEKVLKTNSIKFQNKGLTLVDAITTRPPVPNAPRGPSCDCDYHRGGCMISKSPPEGYACKCIYKGFWTCTGTAFSCEPNQRCPANCSSQQCCQTGRGDCGGY